MGILLVRLIDVINEYSEDSTFYSIAYTMLLNFDNLQNLSINDVANLCHVSKSTISKFVRSLNFEDYSDFKVQKHILRKIVLTVIIIMLPISNNILLIKTQIPILTKLFRILK